MYDMRSNIMVNIVNQSVVPINCCKPSPQITPFLIQHNGGNFQHLKRKKAILQSSKQTKTILAHLFFFVVMSHKKTIIYICGLTSTLQQLQAHRYLPEVSKFEHGKKTHKRTIPFHDTMVICLHDHGDAGK